MLRKGRVLADFVRGGVQSKVTDCPLDGILVYGGRVPEEEQALDRRGRVAAVLT